MAGGLRFKIRTDRNGVRWTPLDASLQGALVTSSNRSPPLWTGRVALRFRYLAEALLVDLAPDALRSLIGAALAGAAYLSFVGLDYGTLEMLGEAPLQIAAVKAALLSTCIVFMFSFLWSLIWPRRKEGVWYGRQFVYDEPKRLLTVQVTSDDNGKAFPMRVPGARAGAFAKFRIAVDRKDNRVRTWLNLAPAAPPTWEGVSVNHDTGFRLSSSLPVFLIQNCAHDATATTIRVYLLSLTYADKIAARHT